MLEAVSAAGARETKREATSASLAVTFATARKGVPSTRSITCISDDVVADVEWSEFRSEEPAREHYISLRDVLATKCKVTFVETDDFEDIRQSDAQPALPDSTVYSVHSTPIAGASCRDDTFNRVLFFSRMDSISDTRGRERNWVVEENYQRNQ